MTIKAGKQNFNEHLAQLFQDVCSCEFYIAETLEEKPKHPCPQPNPREQSARGTYAPDLVQLHASRDYIFGVLPLSLHMQQNKDKLELFERKRTTLKHIAPEYGEEPNKQLDKA